MPNDGYQQLFRHLAGGSAARVTGELATHEPAGPVPVVAAVATGSGSVSSAGFFRKFQKGDTVFHRPTGETWSLIADEKDGWVTPGGWPPSQGRAEDCKLVERGRQAEDESVRQPSPNIPNHQRAASAEPSPSNDRTK